MQHPVISPNCRRWIIEALQQLGAKPEPIAPVNHLRNCEGGSLCVCGVPEILRKPIYAFTGPNAGVSGRVRASLMRKGQRLYLIGNDTIRFLLVAGHCQLLTEEQYSNPTEP